MVEASARLATYADIVAALPHLIAEIIGGHLRLRRYFGMIDGMPLSTLLQRLVAPSMDVASRSNHQVLLRPEFHVGADVLVPELGMWHSCELWNVEDWRDLKARPRWVLEYLTSWTDVGIRQERCRIFGEAQIDYLWRLDAEAGTIEAYENRDGRRWQLLRKFGAGDKVTAPPFAAIALSVDDLWSLGRHRTSASKNKQCETEPPCPLRS